MVATVLGHVTLILVVVVGALIMRDKTPLGFLALATLALGQLCPKCMAAVLTGTRARKATKAQDGHGHE